MSSSKNLSDIWKLKRRGKRDSDRHKELIRDAIKKNSKDLITQYDVITTDGNKKIKVPIKFLEQYKFKYGKINDKSKVGQGLDGKKGNKYRVRGPGQTSGGPAGNENGDLVYEEEITIDEMVNILLEELNLPWMKPNESSAIEVESDIFNSIEKKGVVANLDIKKTILRNIKRNIALKKKKLIGSFSKDDMRYRTWETEIEYESNAAVYMMMDRSGSMDREKKEIAKTFYFWMLQFLKKKYKNIKIIFIAHDARAYEVTEREFFTISSSGGTKCSSAFEKAYELISLNHSSSEFNNYVFEFSDGDNYKEDNYVCLDYIQKLLPMCRAIGYGEIILDNGMHIWVDRKDLLSTILDKNIKRTRFVSVQMKSREDIFEGLKRFFNVEGKGASE